MYQAAIEGLLGLQRHGGTFSINPSIPAMWETYEITWTIGRTRYHINVTNPEHRCGGVATAVLDGIPVDAQAIPLVDDERTHDITIILGRVSAADVRRAAAR
jgi:cyclic beta-1,2-glucan synthetase